MPHTSQLTISQSSRRRYRSSHSQSRAIACIRYDSDDEETPTVGRSSAGRGAPSSTVSETTTYRVITEVVGSKDSKRSRQIHFEQDTGFTAPPLDWGINEQALTNEGEHTFWGSYESQYTFFSDGESDGGQDENVFTPIGLGSTNGDNVSEPVIVSSYACLCSMPAKI